MTPSGIATLNHPSFPVTWQTSGTPAWTLFQSAMQPDAETEIGTRWIAKEPLVSVLFERRAGAGL